MQAAAFEANSFALGIVDDLCRGDRPARPLRAAALRRDRAGRVNGIAEGRNAVGPGAVQGGDATAVLEHDHEVVDRSFTQSVGQLDRVADYLVALRREQDDIAPGEDLSRLAVPDDLVGREILPLAVHPDLARGGDLVRVAIVGDLVGTEGDDLVSSGGSPGCRGRRRASASRLVRPARRARRNREKHGERRPPDKSRPQRSPPALE